MEKGERENIGKKREIGWKKRERDGKGKGGGDGERGKT